MIFLSVGITSFSQIEYRGEVNLEGYYSNKEKLPFWFYSNQRGRISEETNVAGWISGNVNYEFSSESSLEVAGGILFQDAFSDEVFIDELYIDYKYRWLQIIGGRKQEKELYHGLSATNENFAWSLNARPMPGFQIQTSRPFYLNENKKLGFEFSWEDYLTGNDRFVEGTQLHIKSVYVVSNFVNSWQLKAGVKHFAQWGGDSPESGPQPQSFSDYLRIISGREGGENAVDGDKVNVAGSHLGTYELYLTRKFQNFDIKFIYNHFFEDGTGSRYANFPDGRYALYFEKHDKGSFLKGWMYEFYYTKNQSNNSSAPHKNDNYFDNRVTYNSGWTYQRRIIGVPFFDYSREEDKVIGNKFLAHHIGMNGNLRSYPFKLLATYIRKYGTLSKSYNPGREEVYLKYEMALMEKPFNLKMMLGAEYSNIAEPIYGAGVSLSRSF